MFTSIFKTFQNTENKKNYQNSIYKNSKTFNHYDDSEKNKNKFQKNTLSDDHFRKYIMDSSLSSLNKYNVTTKNNLKTIDFNQKMVTTLNNTLSNDKIKVDVPFLFLAMASSIGIFLFYRYK
jgi:hypothetical protein